MAGRGRRSGSDTRELVIEAARELFTTQGYEATSMRAIARQAGVDPRMVHHWFASKPELLLISVGGLDFAPSERIEAVLAEHPANPGRALVTAFLSAWDSPGNPERFAVIVRAALSNDAELAPMREFISSLVLKRLTDQAEGQDAELRATMAASQLIGLGLGRYVIKLPALSVADPTSLIAHYGDLITGLLSPNN